MLLDYFQRARTEFKDVLHAAHAQQNAFSGEVRLGCPEGWDISSFLPSLVEFFRDEYPKVRVELVGLPLSEIEDALQAGMIQAAVTMEYALKDQTDLTTHPLTAVHSVLLHSKEFRAPHDGPLTLADFKDSTFYLVAGNSTPPFRKLVIQRCREYGFEPKIVNCPSLTTALFCVQNNQGVFLGNEMMVANHLDHLYAYLNLNDRKRTIVLAWRAEEAAERSPLRLFLNETLYNRKLKEKLAE